MSLTRKTHILNNYLRLCKNIEIKIDKKIMPNIDDYNFVDLITIFNYYFIDVNDANFKEKIDYIISLQNEINLTEDELNIIYPLIYDFIKWYKNFH